LVAQHFHQDFLASVVPMAWLASFELRRDGKWFRRIDEEHDELVEIRRPTAEDLHRRIGRMAVHRPTGIGVHHTIRCPLAELASENIEGL
jgi:hypothetical protein